jgi:LmbE family N-acetylglucosaminyl deacetylase
MNILAIGAHFDDIELGCGGTIAKHVYSGDKVYVFVATKSGFSNHKGSLVRSNMTAEKEGQQAMKVLGVNKLIQGGFETLKIEFKEELNLLILNLVNKYRIDKVYTHWDLDIHHDHQVVAKSSLHSCRHVKNILMYRSNWYHSNGVFNGNFYVDISNFWKTKKRSIECHKSELKRINNKWIEFFYNEAVNAGQKIGVKLAENFQIVKYLK